MARYPNWDSNQIDYLREHWGIVSLPGISKKLGRSETAIKIKAQKLGLGAFLENGDYITLNQLLIAVTGSQNCYSYKTTSWVQERALPVHDRRVNNNTFRVVYLNEFWKWAEQNKSFLDFSKMEENALGAEPSWVKAQRKMDFEDNFMFSKIPWTKVEDQRLVAMLKKHRYTYAELSKMLKRTCGAIQRRCCDLEIKERPVKAGNQDKWSDEQLRRVAEGIRQGLGHEQIAEKIGKSSKALRGKIFTVYLTENLDKVRSMLGNGSWGRGAPIPTVEQAKRKASVKKDLSFLAGLLALRRNELGWDPYWQKDMCMHWYFLEGCLKCQENCDVCSEFARIKPQYCVRCGKTFFERETHQICASCREARIKQARRKWSAMGNTRNEEVK